MKTGRIILKNVINTRGLIEKLNVVQKSRLAQLFLKRHTPFAEGVVNVFASSQQKVFGRRIRLLVIG